MFNVLANIRTDFSLHPRLSGHADFENNASYRLCRVFGLFVCHGWVINPEVDSYETLKNFSHAELVDHCREREGQDDHLTICQSLLRDSKDQLTSYGFHSLPAELNDDGVALLYCRNRLHLIHKHAGVVLMYVTDEHICNQMPEANWMVFREQRHENKIYFTEKYTPVKGQLCEEEAREFYRKFFENRKGKKARRNKRKKEKKKEKMMSSQQGQSIAASESFEPSGTTGNGGEGKSSDELAVDGDKTAEVAEAVGSHQTGQDDTGSSTEDHEASEALGSQHTERQDATTVSSTEEDKRAERVVSHHIDTSVSQEGVKASMREEVDNVPEGTASDFLSFLIDFKEDGCSKPYFRGIVAAFPSHCPLFYVPYYFILAHDEQLALNIQYNYSRIYEDLKKSVVRYLSMNEVEFPDVVLKIIGLPEPKSYNDKPNGKLEDATIGNLVQGLLDSISDDKRTGYLYSEVPVYSEPQHVSVLFNDADLAQLQIQLNNNGFKSELTGDGYLRCGSVLLYTRDYPPTEEYDGRSVIVVEGSFSVEYEAVFLFLTGVTGSDH